MTFGTFYRCRAGSFSTTFSQSRLTSAGKNKSALRMKCRKSGRLVENRRSAVQWPKLQRSIPAHAATDPRPGVPHAWLDCFFHQRSIAVLRQFAALPAKLGNDGMVTLTLALVLWNAPAATASSAKQLTVDRELLEGLLLENAESRIHTLSDEELLKLFREVARSKAPDVKDAPPQNAGYLSGLTKQFKADNNPPAKQSPPKEASPSSSLQEAGSRSSKAEQGALSTSTTLPSTPEEGARKPVAEAATESDLTSTLLKDSGVSLPPGMDGDPKPKGAKANASRTEDTAVPGASSVATSPAQTPAEYFLEGVVALLKSPMLVSGFSLAGLAGLTYIFFKYIASDDEEGSDGTADGASTSVPASLRNGVASAPVQPPPQGRWSQPLKLITEVIPQLTNIGALVQQRLPFGRGVAQSAESSGKEAEGTDLQRQAGASTSRPDAGEQSTEQAAAKASIPYRTPGPPPPMPQASGRRPDAGDRRPEGGSQQGPPVLWQRNGPDRIQPAPQISQKGVNQSTGTRPGVLWERGIPSQDQSTTIAADQRGARDGAASTLSGSARNPDSRPRYPSQQPHQLPAGPWRSSPRDQAADLSGSWPGNPASADGWAPATPQPADRQGGAAPPSAAKQSQPQTQKPAARAEAQAPPRTAAERSEMQAPQAAATQSHRGLQVSESDRLWHSHLADPPPNQSDGLQGGNGASTGDGGPERRPGDAERSGSGSPALPSDSSVQASGPFPQHISGDSGAVGSGSTTKLESKPADKARDATPGQSNALPPLATISRLHEPMAWVGGSFESKDVQREGSFGRRGQAPSSVQATMSDGALSSDDEGCFPRQRHRDAFRKRQSKRRGLFRSSQFG